MPLEAALQTLASLRLGLSVEIDDAFRDPDVHGHPVQVWFERGRGISSILTLTGEVGIRGREVSWKSANLDEAANALGTGGRVLIRFHAGSILDVRGRPYSASFDALLRQEHPKPPGGVFESWFFVQGG